MAHLWKLGYSSEDIIGNVFRVCKTMKMDKHLQLEYIQVRAAILTGSLV